MKKIFKIIVLAMAFAPLFGNAATPPADPYARNSGFFIQGGVGVLLNHINKIYGYKLNSAHGFGAMVAGGYQVNKYLALEIDFPYENEGRYRIGPLSGKLSVMSIAPAIRGILPLTNRFSIYGKLGVAYPFVKVDNFPATSEGWLDPYVGVGMAYALNRHWDVNAEVSGTVNSHIQDGLGMLGLTYHFS